jgi:hypothetical protein
VSVPDLLDDLLRRWEDDEERLREFGQEAVAGVVARCRSELAERLREIELLTISEQEAEEVSGYSRSALFKLRQRGVLTNAGKNGSPRYRLSELPRKPGVRKSGPVLVSDLGDNAVRARAKAAG